MQSHLNRICRAQCSVQWKEGCSTKVYYCSEKAFCTKLSDFNSATVQWSLKPFHLMQSHRFLDLVASKPFLVLAIIRNQVYADDRALEVIFHRFIAVMCNSVTPGMSVKFYRYALVGLFRPRPPRPPLLTD